MASPNVSPLSLALATGGDPGRVAVIEISSDSDSDCGGGKQGGGNGSSGTCSEPMIDISSSDDEPSSPRRNTKRARVSDLAPPNFLQPLHHHTSPSQLSSLPAMRSSPGQGVHGGGEGGSGDGGDGGVGGDSGEGGVIGGGEGGRGDGGGGGGDGERGCGNSRAGGGSGDVEVSDSNISSEISSDTTMGRTSSDDDLYSPPANVLRALMMTSPSSLLARRSNPSRRCSNGAASRRPATHPAGFGATAWPYELLDPAVHGKHRGQLSLLRVAEPPPPQPGIQPLAPVVGTYHGQTGVNLQRLHDLAVEADAGVRTLLGRIRHGLGPTQPAEMEVVLEKVGENARGIIAMSSSRSLADMATKSSTTWQRQPSPDLQTGCSAWLEPEEPVE